MPVDSTHPKYAKYAKKWIKCREVAEGEDEVKEQREKYLPRLTKQTVPQYDAYKLRAMFYAASGRTVEGLAGAVMRKPPTITPDTADLGKVDNKNATIDIYALDVLTEVVKTGRVGVLVEAPTNGGDPYFVTYQAENVINWRFEYQEGQLTPLLIVLKESYELDTGDEFEWKMATQYRVLKMSNGVYLQEIWRKTENTESFELYETIKPESIGQDLDNIPFFFINAKNYSPDLVEPPIIDVVNVNLSHYRSSADLEHGRHFTGLPVPYFSGFKLKKDEEIRVGSDVGLTSNDPNAKGGYIEFSGSGLKYLENALKDKEDTMVVLGARLLEQQKTAVEATDTHRLRKMGENSVLAQIANSVSSGLTYGLELMANWNKTEPVTIKLNTDFITDKMSPAELKEWVLARQSGEISKHVFYHNLQKGEVYPEDWDYDREQDAIEAEMPTIPEEE